MTTQEKILQRLWDPPLHTFALLDAARNESIYPTLKKSREEIVCLYEGTLDPELAAAAPYLVRIQPDSALLPWILEQGWGDSWGIFVHSRSDTKELRRNFRRYLRVMDHTQKVLYFRYYDPRVFRVYIPTCNPQELKVVFGPAHRFLVEGEDPNILIEYIKKNEQLSWKYVNLTT